MVAIKAHYDGRVIVPDEPVSLLTDAKLLVWVQNEPMSRTGLDQAIRDYYLGMSDADKAEDDAWGKASPNELSDAWEND